MIVKNESAIIERCLSAAAAHVDAAVICDTGSTDATVSIVERFFAARGIPCLVPRTTFRNFEQARNEALDAARAGGPAGFDYLLLCDADMELRVERPDFRAGLSEPVYMVVQRTAGHGLEYENVRLVRRDVACRYVGVTHEYLDCGNAAKAALAGVWFLDHAVGANRSNKYQRDIALLTEGLKAEPGNARYAFYLANSYYDLGEAGEALAWYDRRARMGGWSEEVFYSSYRAGLCAGMLGREAESVARLLDVHERFPHRAETMHALALHYQRAGKHRLAYHFAQIGAGIAKPAGALFVDADVYAWRCQDIVSVSLYYLGRKQESAELCRRLLEIVPDGERPRVFQNLRWAEGP
jgi:tetratricopeptide (TPR) repeat protein